MPHCFEVEIAKKYGLLEAILLNYFLFWIKKNEANEAHFHDGLYWTYNSVKAFCDLFPYASTKMIRNAIDHLIDEGLLITGNFNKSPFDQTKWYALTEKGLSICPIGELDLPHRANENCPQGQMRFAPQGKPIPVNNINNTVNNEQATDYESEFETLWSLYPNKKGKKNALKYYIRARKAGTDYETVEAGIKAYIEYIRKTKAEKYIQYGSTFFNGEGWNDDWSTGFKTPSASPNTIQVNSDATSKADEIKERMQQEWERQRTLK